MKARKPKKIILRYSEEFKDRKLVKGLQQDPAFVKLCREVTALT